MSEATETEKLGQPKVNSSTPVSWADFLATYPPNKETDVTGMGRHMTGRGPNFVIDTPDLSLHCDICGGSRTFHCEEHGNTQLAYNYLNKRFLIYVCANCPGPQKTRKLYAVLCRWNFTVRADRTAVAGKPVVENISPRPKEENRQIAIKLGELPPFGPIPSPKLIKLIKLVKPDRALFEIGQRAKAEGMGIGAFAYYRRVVENHRTALFDKLILAAERLNINANVIEALRKDRDNWQFSQSLDQLKVVMPERLKVKGHNPLALLHRAISHDLHRESDEMCLEAARDIRVVLTYLAEQLDEVLRDQSELEKTVSRLSRKALRK